MMDFGVAISQQNREGGDRHRRRPPPSLWYDLDLSDQSHWRMAPVWALVAIEAYLPR